MIILKNVCGRDWFCDRSSVLHSGWVACKHALLFMLWGRLIGGLLEPIRLWLLVAGCGYGMWWILYIDGAVHSSRDGRRGLAVCSVTHGADLDI